MTILQEPVEDGDRRVARGWQPFGHGDQAVRYTEAWEHENFAEEQARWERCDPEYARICERVRQARKSDGQASRRADEAKAEWDARMATQRQTNDDAQRAHHALRGEQTARRRPASSRTPIGARAGDHHLHTTFAIESNDSPAPGIIPEPVRVHDARVARTASRGERQAAGLRFRGQARRDPVSSEPTKVGVE